MCDDQYSPIDLKVYTLKIHDSKSLFVGGYEESDEHSDLMYIEPNAFHVFRDDS